MAREKKKVYDGMVLVVLFGALCDGKCCNDKPMKW